MDRNRWGSKVSYWWTIQDSNFMRDILRRIWQLPCMYRKLQRIVEIFVGIVFLDIRGQEGDLDLLPVFLQSG